jgi:hypothetical protein
MKMITSSNNFKDFKYRNPALQVRGGLKNRDNKICSRVLWDSDLRKTALAMPRNN